MKTSEIRIRLNHAVTAFDRKQEARAAKRKGGYHNAYALGQYLARVDDVCADIEAGATPQAAVMAGFTPGPLRNACLKAIGASLDDSESHGSFMGLPVYSPASSR